MILQTHEDGRQHPVPSEITPPHVYRERRRLLQTLAGGVAGAVLGNQIGKGDGRTAARILGAVGGAYAGREIEKNVVKQKRYDVSVRLHNGTTQTVQHTEDPGLKDGQQVKIVNGKVVAND